MNHVNAKKAVGAILFVAGNPVSLKQLAKILELPEEEVQDILKGLKEELTERGINITESNNSYQMATNPAVSAAVKNFLQLELREKLTEAAIETLSVIAYKQPIARSEIEAVRGVNSQYILRLLLQRGLIEKMPSPSDARVLLYRTTHEFLHHLGIKNIKELPEFEQISKNIEVPNAQKSD